MASDSKTAAAPSGQVLSRDEILRILEERTQAAQSALAGQTDAGDEVLSYLAEQGAPATRRAVAANLAAPAHANRLLANDDDDDVRVELARKIGRLIPGLSRSATGDLHQLTIETLERLAADQLPRVRAILAEGIKNLTCVPAHVVRALARDVEAAVAAPILEYSPLLSDSDLLEIIAGGKVHQALAAIAQRKPLNADVSDAIVSSLDIPAVSALLTNHDAAIREKTLDRIVEEARAIGSWHEPLVLRADLSQRTIRRLASFVGAALIASLATRHGLDEETQSQLNRELRLRLEHDDQAPQIAAAAALEEVKAAAKAGRLDELFVESAAEAGRREVVLLALSALGRVPEDIVRKILLARSAKPAVALVWRCGLGMRAAFKIQRFVMKLPASELLPARDGVHFPLNEEEMGWHLSYFDVPV